MPLLLILLTALFGLIVGSFLNVVVLRDDRRLTILTGRSECPHCKHELSWFELVPIASFVMQGGKCRSCKKRISWQYPLGELMSAAIAVFALWYGYVDKGSLVLAAGVYIALACFLVISTSDLRTMEIRPEYTVIAALVAGLANVVSGERTITSVLLGLVIGGGIIFILAYGWKIITGRLGMGEGDIWIAAAVGALVGYPLIFAALFLAVVIGAVVGVIIVAGQQKKELSVAIPFGPFLAIGGVLALVWGQALLQWYILGV